MCSCCMTREKYKGDRKLRCWHPFKVPDHCFGETEGWKHFAKGRGNKKPLCSLDCGPAFWGHGGRPKFSVTLSVLLLCSNTQLTFQARVADVTHM